ncbi:MAG TPA: protein phosphatase 2C domain-containing protein [Gemmatimonadaceae bacterium]|jgi:serine/threonine protein phosphatase PrpC|nr:protein phosphatase 2C domain-containing protein [Gemmatimonadaceae bacterium]
MRQSFTTGAPSGRKPLDDEIDVYGLTHKGRVRTVNQDNFLICSMRKSVAVHLTSLADLDRLSIGTERLAFLAMVADGVGGGVTGDAASRLAVEAVTEYVARTMDCYSSVDETNDVEFARALEDAALHVHSDILQQAEENPELAGMATTLTLWLGAWPRAYLLQVGDSRCYLLRDGELIQVSRDQTMAQELVDSGALKPAEASRSRWANVLSSSIGGPQTAPVVYRLTQVWGQVGLLCSDGLTKHVSNERIRERLSSMTSARQVCQDLLQDALDAGGTDNITVVVGRTVPNAAEKAVTS